MKNPRERELKEQKKEEDAFLAFARAFFSITLKTSIISLIFLL